MEGFRLRQVLTRMGDEVRTGRSLRSRVPEAGFHVLTCAWLMEIRLRARKKMPKIGLSVLFPAGSILTEPAFVRESQGHLAAARCFFKRREGEKGCDREINSHWPLPGRPLSDEEG